MPKPDHNYVQCTPQGCKDHIPHDFFTKETWDKWFANQPPNPIEIEENIFYRLLTGRK